MGMTPSRTTTWWWWFVVAVLCIQAGQVAGDERFVEPRLRTVADVFGATGATDAAAHLVLRPDAKWTNTWQRTLEEERWDDDDDEAKNNKASRPDPRVPREVRDGHWVRASPSPLPEPYVVACSRTAAALVGLRCPRGEREDAQDVKLEESRRQSEALWARVFSGDAPEWVEWYATPYALSIYGSEQVPRGAGERGDAYGDGRVAFLGEVDGKVEVQLKGAGRTAFARTGDGRAVLRSSTREFLASEAMHHLGVPTTRALTLVATDDELAQRPWYRDDAPTRHKHGGDVLVEEKCAVATRLADSFARVGHFDLYARRTRREQTVAVGTDDTSTTQTTAASRATAGRQLRMLADHVAWKLGVLSDQEDLALEGDARFTERVVSLATESARRQAKLAAEWLRVGYAQSNFNADNCLVSGETVDYGPFGFVERFRADWAMWIHSGSHFSFLNQPAAAEKNFDTFKRALRDLCAFHPASSSPAAAAESETRVLNATARDECDARVAAVAFPVDAHVDAVWARKMGFAEASDQTRHLWRRLVRLMHTDQVDFTIFWRQLAVVAEHGADMAHALRPAFYDDDDDDDGGRTEGDETTTAQLKPNNKARPLSFQWDAWLRTEWLPHRPDPRLMRATSPKYVPREWMLRDAYQRAEQGDFSEIHRLAELFETPYDEHPDLEHLYYRKAPPDAQYQGGLGFMS